jgi:hypothetical protein
MPSFAHYLASLPFSCSCINGISALIDKERGKGREKKKRKEKEDDMRGKGRRRRKLGKTCALICSEYSP